jgi:hypothetical protein
MLINLARRTRPAGLQFVRSFPSKNEHVCKPPLLRYDKSRYEKWSFSLEDFVQNEVNTSREVSIHKNMIVPFLITVVFLHIASALLPAQHVRPSTGLGAAGSDLATLERKLLSKLTHGDSATTSSPSEETAATKPILSATRLGLRTVASSVSVPPVDKSPTSLSPLEVCGGVALGAAPFIVIPAVAYSVFKSKLQKQKPFPSKTVEQPVPPKVPRYTKSLKEGMKEGIEELKSGKPTPEVKLIQKGLKINLAGIGATALVGVALFLNQGLNGPQSAVFRGPPDGQQVAKVSAPKPSLPIAVEKQPAKTVEKSVASLSSGGEAAAVIGTTAAVQAPSVPAVPAVPASPVPVSPAEASVPSTPSVVAAPPQVVSKDRGVTVPAAEAATVASTTVASATSATPEVAKETPPARPTPETDPKPAPNTVQSSDQAIAPQPGQKTVVEPTPETANPPVVKKDARRAVQPDVVDPKAFEKFSVSELTAFSTARIYLYTYTTVFY